MLCLPRVAFVVLLSASAAPSYAEISDALAAALVSAPTPERAAPLVDPLAGRTTEALLRPQDYYVVQQPVASVLETVAKAADLRLSYSNGVKGLVRQTRLAGTTAEVLDALSVQAGLDWFTFNGIVYISARDEAVARMIRLGDLTPDQALKAVTDAGLSLARVEAHPTSVDNVLAMSGPPELLAIAEAIVESIPPYTPPAAKSKPARTLVIRRGNEENWVTLRH